MPILIEIPEQKATSFQKRQAVLLECDKNGYMKLEGKDALRPSVFFLSAEDQFPWKSFLEKLKVAWFRSANQVIPRAFQLQKRITDDILTEMDRIEEKDIPKVLAALRKNGFFKPLPNRIKL